MSTHTRTVYITRMHLVWISQLHPLKVTHVYIAQSNFPSLCTCRMAWIFIGPSSFSFEPMLPLVCACLLSAIVLPCLCVRFGSVCIKFIPFLRCFPLSPLFSTHSLSHQHIHSLATRVFQWLTNCFLFDSNLSVLHSLVCARAFIRMI